MSGNDADERAVCASCGWPARQDGMTELSWHRTSQGVVRYLRCVCGAWIVELADLGGGVPATVRGPG